MRREARSNNDDDLREDRVVCKIKQILSISELLG